MIRSAHAHRPLWHLLPEAATLLAAARPRPGDLRAVRHLLTRPGAGGRLSLAGVGLWAAHRAREQTVLVDSEGVVTGTELIRLVAARAEQLRGAGAVLLHDQDDRRLVTTLVAAGVAGVDVVLLGARAGAEEVTAAEARVQQLAATRGAGRAPAVVLHSSGTTGHPHPRTQRAVRLGQLPTVVSLAAALGARRAEPMLVAAPVAHGHGLSALAAAFALGAPVLLGAAARPDRGLDLMVEHRVRTWVGLPTQLADLLHAAGEEADRMAALRRLRRVVTGSAPVPTEVVTQVHQRVGEVLVSYYGTTEAGTATIARPADLAAAPATAGRPATGVRVQVRDQAGRLAPVGQVGQVVLRSRWRAPGEPEWVHTKDRGRLDDSGRLLLAGRSDDAVLVGGHVVHLAAVTSWLRNHPEVQQVQVRAVPHERLGSALEARVRSTGSLAALHAQARAALGDAAAPRLLLPW
ncbi:class I adenylate-forming enzyme family protein [Ruania albidiflava]|uniref:class I adenylate-forming enzyme family protein n=1 Tax=Ruania albidiflava TaxID=366586 RepID=UPI0003B5B41E|nr:AMP-binding protein [Ruania albidiflava]